MSDGPGPTRVTEVLEDTVPEDPETWWLLDDEAIGPAMVRIAEKYEIAQQDRRDASRRYVQLFKGKLIVGSMYDSGRAPTPAEDLHPAWNIVQAAQNTAASVVVRNRVRVAVITDGADYEKQEAAKLGESFVAGIFRGNKLYEEHDPVWFLDGGVPGLGALACEPDANGHPRIRRIIPDGIVYSETEAVKGKPRQLFIVEWLPKWQVIEEHGDTPEKVTAIKACTTTYSAQLAGSPDYHVPMIPVWTGFFLANPNKKNDRDRDKKKQGQGKEEKGEGRRVVAIPGMTLSVREWKWPRFPVSFFRVEVAPAGLWGIGIAERLAGFQYRLHEINSDIDEARRMGSVGKWLVDNGANVNDDEFTDEQGGIVHYSKVAPKWEKNDGIPDSLLKERQETYMQGLKEIGLSEWSVAGIQPDNLESGEALRQLREQEQGRALPAGQNWEAAHVDLAEVCIMAACDGYELNPELEVWAEEGESKDLVKVAFKDVAKLLTSPDSWKVQAYPTAFLPSSPQGKFEKLKEWEQKGWIDSASAAALSDMPDLNQESTLLLAGIKAVRWAITKIKRQGQDGYEPPDPSMPLQLAARIAQATILEGMRQGMPEDKLVLLQQWQRACIDLLNGKPNPQAAATPGEAAPSAPVAPVNAPPPPPGAAPAPAPGPAPMPVNQAPPVGAV